MTIQEVATELQLTPRRKYVRAGEERDALGLDMGGFLNNEFGGPYLFSLEDVLADDWREVQP